jgi:hypothetical protein
MRRMGVALPTWEHTPNVTVNGYVFTTAPTRDCGRTRPLLRRRGDAGSGR